jgi:hypothetical protein
MGGIEAIEAGSPERDELFIHGWSQTRAFEFAQKFLLRTVGEAHVGGEKLLVEDGRSQETRDLLLFHRVARQRHDVANAGKDEAGDPAFEGLEEGDFAVLEGKDSVAFAELHAVLGGDGVDVLRIDRQGIQSGEKFARRRIRGTAYRRKKTPRNHQEEAKPHEKSVDTFGMKRQGGRPDFPRGVKMDRCGIW